ncbi:helix-turn-helix transcriptional regulator [Kroppenstedtia eburnea]|uniref:helix-turn-helix transcriptional regulator n=1 Tax=Kroppenstedtia eburnea TaxID=714067 RepID=UPI003635F260
MRADRLVSILLLLQVHGRMTAKSLSERLEVSQRTIHRDMEALSAAGVPVVAERGAGGGWRLLEGYRTNLTGLKESELRALLVSPSDQLLSDLGLNRTAEDARNKLLAALPAMDCDGAKEVRQRIHIDTSTWRQSREKMASFETLQAAIWNENKIQIRYERADGQSVDRLIEPLGLVAKGSVWYLVAVAEGEPRSYRVSRIRSAELTEERFNRPDSFDLARYWKMSTQTFLERLPNVEVRVKGHPSILPRLKFTSRFLRILEIGSPASDGWIPITLSFDTEQEAAETILGFGDRVIVTAPESLQRRVIAMAKAVVQRYDQPSDSPD